MDERQKKVLVLVAVVIITIVGFTQFVQTAASSYEIAEMPLGNTNCSVELGLIAMKDGVVVNSPILNNPLYLDGVEIDSIAFAINVRAEGTDVDWNKLSVTCVLTVNAQSLNSWEWNILDFTSKDGGLEVDVTWNIEELDYLTGTTPDWTDADGIGHFTILAEADVYGSLEDTKGNALNDAVKVTNTWDLTDANEATTIPLVVPEFTTTPNPITVDYGAEFEFVWVASDDNPSTFKITTYYLDGGSQIVVTGSWTTSQQISYSANALFASLSVDPATGEYPDVKVSVVCFVYDDDGQSMFDSVVLTVNAPTEITADPIKWDKATSNPSGTVAPKSYEVTITYYPSAIYTPNDWKLYVNGALRDSGTWGGGSVSVWVEQVIEAGVKYNFMLTVSDTDGHTSSYTVTITGEAAVTDITDIGTDGGDGIVNLPFEIPGLGVGGSLTVYGILAVFAVYFLYRRWRED